MKNDIIKASHRVLVKATQPSDSPIMTRDSPQIQSRAGKGETGPLVSGDSYFSEIGSLMKHRLLV